MEEGEKERGRVREGGWRIRGKEEEREQGAGDMGGGWRWRRERVRWRDRAEESVKRAQKERWTRER
jgi:hypothetical protein